MEYSVVELRRLQTKNYSTIEKVYGFCFVVVVIKSYLIKKHFVICVFKLEKKKIMTKNE